MCNPGEAEILRCQKREFLSIQLCGIAAHGIGSAVELAGESLVHHCHALRVWAVAIGKDTAGKQRHLQCAEISGRDIDHIRPILHYPMPLDFGAPLVIGILPRALRAPIINHLRAERYSSHTLHIASASPLGRFQRMPAQSTCATILELRVLPAEEECTRDPSAQ
jgi:hypothetical protein